MQPSWAKTAAIVIVVWSAYVFGFLAAFPHLGFTTLKLVFVAVALTGWFGGMTLGIIAGVIAVPANQILLEMLLPGSFALLAHVGADRVADAVLAVSAGGVAGYLCLARRKLAIYPQVTLRANHDGLTGLLNRSSFEARFADLIEEAREFDGPLALLFVDLDRFKFVNDTFGHEIGDEVLKKVAGILKSSIRQNDVAARLGGDEFVLAVRGVRDKRSAEMIAVKIINQLSTPFSIQGKAISIGASIGISMSPEDGEDIRTLTKNADSAMYRVKSNGRNWYAFSTQEIRQDESWRLSMERHLRWAMEKNELSIVYQPIVDLRSNGVVGFEALVRWSNQELGNVSPTEFIPLAEEVGLILPINRWVLRESCRQNHQWRQSGFPPTRIAVNISGQLFMQPDFVKQVQQALAHYDLPPEALEIEITETVLLRDPQHAISTLSALKRIGIEASLDDFGTGYSSLAYLQQLPISKIKLDRSFVSNLISFANAGNSSAMITEAICALAEKLHVPVIAEGVETVPQRQYLERLECPLGQGFLFFRPMRPREVEKLLVLLGIRHEQQRKDVVRQQQRDAEEARTLTLNAQS